MQNITPKTIQIFLPEGEPRGMRVAYMTTGVVQAVAIPRSKMEAIDNRAELKGVGVYFLFGESRDEVPLVYIGEAENCWYRIKQHHVEKDFWQTAVCFVSRTGDFTKAHVKFLESYCIQKCTLAARYTQENKHGSAEPSVPEAMRADIMDAFLNINILLSALGFPIFETLRKTNTTEEIFYCKTKFAEAEGIYNEEGFVVLKGAKIRKELTPSMGERFRAKRDELIVASILQDKGPYYILQSDHVFNSPSAASDIICGTPTNGWEYWKNKDGRSLNEVKRRLSTI